MTPPTDHISDAGKMVWDRAAKLRTLADRIEAGSMDGQLLLQCFDAVYSKPEGPLNDPAVESWWEKWTEMVEYTKCGAFLSAAEFLLPTGLRWYGGEDFEGIYYCMLVSRKGPAIAQGKGPNLAAALASAALRAHAVILKAVAHDN